MTTTVSKLVDDSDGRSKGRIVQEQEEQREKYQGTCLALGRNGCGQVDGLWILGGRAGGSFVETGLWVSLKVTFLDKQIGSVSGSMHLYAIWVCEYPMKTQGMDFG